MRESRKVLYHTPFLDLVEIDYVDGNGNTKKWYGVTRSNAPTAVVVAALTDKQELIFVRQPRPLIGGKTIEFPAGLMDQAGENVFETAGRELLEETGYKAERFKLLIGGSRGLTVSSGLSDERLYLVLALDAVKVCDPLLNEGTEPILVRLKDAFSWLRVLEARGADVDYKLFGNVCLIEKVMQNG